uniref:Uncharacterized protein n=1 Tax=Anguilla anguilla TaxID=7936 RepID=A0A0E9TB96_ANGAN
MSDPDIAQWRDCTHGGSLILIPKMHSSKPEALTQVPLWDFCHLK